MIVVTVVTVVTVLKVVTVVTVATVVIEVTRIFVYIFFFIKKLFFLKHNFYQKKLKNSISNATQKLKGPPSQCSPQLRRKNVFSPITLIFAVR